MDITQAGISRRELLVGGALLTLGSGAWGQAAPPPEIIDIHPHIISKDTGRYPPAPLGGQQSDWSRDRPQSFEEYVSQANEAGIAKAAIVQVSTYYGVDDSYLADSVARDPQRFTGVCSIDTVAPDAVQVLQRWRQRGLTGLRIFTRGPSRDLLVDPRAAPVWDYAREHGVTICISTDAAGMAQQVRTLLQRYPQVKIVIDHADFLQLQDGPPYHGAQWFFDLAAFRNLYVKITPTTVETARAGKSTPEQFFPRLVATFGADHIAFGSNLPASPGPLTQIVAQMRASLSDLRAGERAQIFAGTARHLYPVLA